MYLAEDTPYLPDDAFGRAKVWQWLSFELERVAPVIGALRHWTLTGKLAQRAPALVEAKRAVAQRTLAILERELAERSFLPGERYTIADIAVFAYGSRAGEAGFPLDDYPAILGWIGRVRAQPGHLTQSHPYSIDPLSSRDLP